MLLQIKIPPVAQLSHRAGLEEVRADALRRQFPRHGLGAVFAKL